MRLLSLAALVTVGTIGTFVQALPVTAQTGRDLADGGSNALVLERRILRDGQPQHASEARPLPMKRSTNNLPAGSWQVSPSSERMSRLWVNYPDPEMTPQQRLDSLLEDINAGHVKSKDGISAFHAIGSNPSNPMWPLTQAGFQQYRKTLTERGIKDPFTDEQWLKFGLSVDVK